MKKTIVATLLIYSFSAFANDRLICTNSNSLKLTINIVEKFNQKNVFWALFEANKTTSTFKGTGPWQKELESEDAFSAFDNQTAISFKDNRAFFVLPTDQAIYFPNCRKL